MRLQIPGLLSWMAFGDVDAKIPGLNEFPPSDIPPLFIPFVSYHSMVALGMWFILLTLLTAYFLWKDKLWNQRWLLKLTLWSVPLPIIACELGWIAAEVGRQPWTVYHLLRTEHSVSVSVSAETVLGVIILLFVIDILLGISYVMLMMKKIRQGPEPIDKEGV